jgi:hypothetical protein
MGASQKCFEIQIFSKNPAISAGKPLGDKKTGVGRDEKIT